MSHFHIKDFLDRAMQAEMIRQSDNNTPLIARMERLLHYVAIEIVKDSEDDEEIRMVVSVSHQRLDEIVASVAADAREMNRRRKDGRPRGAP